tara:strand:+ start:615 stop:836 length:222 start_codon:yes stop_codon:yes gene_type:complete
MDEPGYREGFFNHPLLQTFIFYSIFRAIYGAGIVVVTWIFATNSNLHPSYSVVFLLFSMVFSRYLFKKIRNNN